MQLIEGRLVYSATDLVGFLDCRYLANLECAATEAHLPRLMRADPVVGRQNLMRPTDTHDASLLAPAC